jgi:hypothetical protein
MFNSNKLIKSLWKLLNTNIEDLLWGPSFIASAYTSNDVTVRFVLYKDGWLYIDNYKQLGLKQGYHKYDSHAEAMHYIYYLTSI